mmetsp:Transcript_55934/g.130985  ORF Transcript_55934/g.130985 Transcript_55934/m.130985 type:complete len:296 (+) Transcript_55934:46-933(+)
MSDAPATSSAPVATLPGSLLATVYGVFQPPPERAQSLGKDFELAFAAAWVYCAAVGILSCLFAARVFGEAYSSLNAGKKAMWHCYTYCLFCGVISCWLMAADVRPFLWDHVLDPNYQYHAKQSQSMRRAVGFSCGFLAFDLTVLLIGHRLLIKAYKRPMYIQMLVHHILSIVSWPLTIQHTLAAGLVGYCIFTESTSIFVNLHWLLREAKVDGTIWGMANGVMLLVSFFVVRVLPVPWVAWCWWSCPKPHWTWAEWSVGALITPLPSLFNLFWFSLILRGAMAKFAKGKTARKAD